MRFTLYLKSIYKPKNLKISNKLGNSHKNNTSVQIGIHVVVSKHWRRKDEHKLAIVRKNDR
jgi:hypothetical protein